MVAGSHHSPESFIIYIKNRENIKKNISTKRGSNSHCRGKDVYQISIFSRLFIDIQDLKLAVNTIYRFVFSVYEFSLYDK